MSAPLSETSRKRPDTSACCWRPRRAAENADRAKTEFLANMSHELRTPISGIMGMLQLLRMSGLNTEDHGYVDNAFNSCKRLTQLLGDILDLSRIEAGMMPPQA